MMSQLMKEVATLNFSNANKINSGRNAWGADYT